MTYQFRLRKEPFDFSYEFDGYENGLLERTLGEEMTDQFRLREEPFEFYSEFDNAAELLTTDFTETWQGEVPQKCFDRYICWVQKSLNKILGLRLAEDGRMGSNTLGAIQRFQRQKGLQSRTDGVVCPDTERALIAAGANPPPGMVEARGHETPPGRTVYVDIPLQIPLGNAKPMTGIFVPASYCPISPVDLIVYLHGFKLRSHQPHFSIDTYWHLPEFLLREEVNESKKNVILVAPTLGPKNEPGSLTCPGGFDSFLDQVMKALKQHGPYSGTQKTPTIRNIILACHSGSGSVMRAIAMGTDTSATLIQECWAFEPANMGDASAWATWARSHPKPKLYIYFLSNTSGQRLCQNLMGGNRLKTDKVNCMPNVVAEKSTARHDDVPRTHLKDRIQGAQFLVDKSKCASSGTRKAPSAIREAPFDLSTESDELVELWDSDGPEEVWQEDVPRNSRDYIRWAQHSLNRFMNVRLPLTGVMDAATRSALRSFQAKRGLPADEVAGPGTRRALAEARAKSSVGGDRLPSDMFEALDREIQPATYLGEEEEFPVSRLPARAAVLAKKTPFRYVKDFAGPAAECAAALKRAGETRAEALTIINAQIGVAIAMLRKAATDLKRGSRSSGTKALFLKIFRVRPDFVPTWLKQTATIKDRGDVVATRCKRVATLLASGKLKFFCTINSTNCPDCPNDPSKFACSSYGDDNAVCLGNDFWDAMKAGDTNSLLATLMHEPFHIYYGRYVTVHDPSRGKFGGIYCIQQFTFETNGRVAPVRVNEHCASMVVRKELGEFLS